MKLIVFAAITALTLCQFLPIHNRLTGPNQDIIQQALNGLFEANGLPDPTTITPCIDDDSAAQIVAFVPKILHDAGRASVADITKIKKEVEDFGNTLNPAVGQCLDGNAELEALGAKFGITPGMDTTALETRVISYITLHILGVESKIRKIEDAWNSGDYYGAGVKASDLGHEVLGSKRKFNKLTGPNQDIIQQFLNGLFEANGLKDPTTITPCIDDDSAAQIVAFVPKILHDAGRASVADITKIKKEVEDFGHTLNPAVGQCLDGNAELEALGAKFGITPGMDTSALETRVISYLTLHILGVQSKIRKIEDAWNSGDYYGAGVKSSDLGHEVLGNKKKINQLTGPNQDIIQQALNGLFEANGLPDPTTITPCIDDDSAAKIVAFVPVILHDAGRASVADINKIKKEVEDFGQTLNPAVGQCLDGNAELEALGAQFGITPGMDTTALETRVISYVTLHILGVESKIRKIQDAWNSGDYYGAGVQGSDLGHEVLGN